MEQNIRSEEIQDVISYIPNWMIRWGISLVFLLFSSMLAFSWFVRFPDVIETPVKLVSAQPPMTIAAPSQGQLEVWRKDGELVLPGEPVGMILNGADYLHMMALKKMLMETADASHDWNKAEHWNLGELKPFFDKWHKAALEAKGFSDDGFERSRMMLENEIRQQKALIADGSALADKRLEIASLQEKLLSLMTRRKSEALRLSQKQNDAFIELNRLMKQWEDKYILRAPVEGKLMAYETLRHNEFVDKGKPLFSVVARDSKKKIGKLWIEQHLVNQVQVGQKVRIALDQKFAGAYIMGEVASVGRVRQEGKYLVKVRLNDTDSTAGLLSLQQYPEWDGQAQVITRQQRLFDRIMGMFLIS